MARTDTLLAGSLMALIAMALVFDDDETTPAPSSSDDELAQGPQEAVDADRPRKRR